jgi:hypothetical protein
MDGQYLKINNQWHEITQPELWAKCQTEKEYFRIVKEQQQKKRKTLLPGLTGTGSDELGF